MGENFFGLTDTGRVRDNNEDAFIAEKLSNGWILACVIDGVGGYEGGEVAAEIARESILTSLKQPSSDIISSLKESLALANHNIYTEKQNGKGNSQMACVLTLALADVENNQFYYAHVGDTRLYLLRDQSLVKVTKDHSFVGFLEDSGRLSEKEAMEHPKRNEINKALGFDAQFESKDDYIETGSSPFLPGDMLMFCSDGLTDLVNNQEMTAILIGQGSLKQKGEALVKAANEAGGKDNITVVLVRNDKKPLKQKATKPVIVKKNESSKDVTAIETKTSSQVTTVSSTKKKGNIVAWMLLLVSLLLAGACYWLWNKNKKLELAGHQAEKKDSSAFHVTTKLAVDVSRAVDTLRLSDSIITLNNRILILHDSLHIIGDGTIIQSDSSYKGAAFIISERSKYIVLENLIFKDFSIGVIARNNSIEFKNVRFVNVENRIVNTPHLSQNDTIKNLSVHFKEPAFISKDSTNQ